MNNRRQHSREFKIEAARLLQEGQKSGEELARELGVHRNQLYKWKKTIAKNPENAFPGSGRHTAGTKEDEIAQLKKTLRRLQEENDILKKAAAFFARELPLA